MTRRERRGWSAFAAVAWTAWTIVLTVTMEEPRNAVVGALAGVFATAATALAGALLGAWWRWVNAPDDEETEGDPGLKDRDWIGEDHGW